MIDCIFEQDKQNLLMEVLSVTTKDGEKYIFSGFLSNHEEVIQDVYSQRDKVLQVEKYETWKVRRSSIL